MDRDTRDMDAVKFWRYPEVRPFLDAIAKNHNDDLPRLVFADWIEERGGVIDAAHAAYIRECVGIRQQSPGAEDFQVPGLIRERVYAGFNLQAVNHGQAVLLHYRNPTTAALYAETDRGILSRVRVGSSPALNDLENLTRDADTERGVWTRPGNWVGPIVSNLQHGATSKPIAMFHPYYLELSNPEHLRLDTFRGILQDHNYLVVYYLDVKYIYTLHELRKLGQEEAGEYVIRSTLSRYWERAFAERLHFPVKVRVTDELAAIVNHRTGATEPLGSVA